MLSFCSATGRELYKQGPAAEELEAQRNALYKLTTYLFTY